jgi:hypothetical protein
MGGLVASIIAALVLIAAIWGLTWFQHRDVADPSPTVDYTVELEHARSVAPFDVAAPDPVPAGWRATSVQFDGTAPEYSWHLGFLTGEGSGVEYVGLEQGNAEPGEFVAASTPADQPGAPAVIDGQTWQTLTSGDGGETALVLNGEGVTTVLTGTAPEDQLVAFARTLTSG